MDEQIRKSHDRHETSNSQEGEKILSDVTPLKTYSLVTYITEYPREADLRWSLFCAACNSYRFDSILKPFPPLFLRDEDHKDIDSLREVIGMCPRIIELVQRLRENKIPPTLLELLHWVLIQLQEPMYKYIPKSEHDNILSQVPSVVAAASPDYIFSVTYGPNYYQKFASMASNSTTKLAFHGSRLENFFSIINQGLQVSFNKRGAFGPGTYLSNEMGISLSYSPAGYSWDSSCFGSHISVVALCELIDDPKLSSDSDSKKFNKSNFFDMYDNKTVPEKYFVVENNDFVHIRYLLVYSSYKAESAALMRSQTLLGWIKRHKLFTFAVAYIILLLAIGSSNSSVIRKFYRRFMR